MNRIIVLKDDLMGNLIPQDVVVWQLILENCDGTRVLSGDISPVIASTGNGYAEDTPLFMRQNDTDSKLNTLTIKDYFFDVSPNPVKQDCTVSFKLPQDDELSLSIFNQLGQVIENYNLGSLYMGEYQQNISTDKLPNGTYIFSLKSKTGKIFTKKINKIN